MCGLPGHTYDDSGLILNARVWQSSADIMQVLMTSLLLCEGTVARIEPDSSRRRFPRPWVSGADSTADVAWRSSASDVRVGSVVSWRSSASDTRVVAVVRWRASAPSRLAAAGVARWGLFPGTRGRRVAAGPVIWTCYALDGYVRRIWSLCVCGFVTGWIRMWICDHWWMHMSICDYICYAGSITYVMYVVYCELSEKTAKTEKQQKISALPSAGTRQSWALHGCGS